MNKEAFFYQVEEILKKINKLLDIFIQEYEEEKKEESDEGLLPKRRLFRG